MKPASPVIVALDSYPLDFDGLAWTRFEQLGHFSKYPRTAPDQLLERAAEAEILVVNKFKLDSLNLPALKKLRCICVTATGTNNVDLDYCRRHQIAVTNVKDYSADSVAQLVFAYLLNLSTRVAEYNSLVQHGSWHSAADFCLGLPDHWELAGKTIGIIGLGSIGTAVSRAAEGFSMKVLSAKVPGREYPPDSTRLPLDQVFSSSDVLTLHIPLTEQTRRIINARTLSLMKPSAILINTGRGDLVDEQALADALKQRRIAHACLDVVSIEPPPADNPLFSAPNVTFTPHIAWSTREARSRLMEQAAENVAAYLQGLDRNRVA